VNNDWDADEKLQIEQTEEFREMLEGIIVVLCVCVFV
jgi:hypothetical protein